MTFAYYEIDPGDVPEHEHANEEVWHVTEGSLEVTVDGQTGVVPAGGAAIVAAGQRHSLGAIEPTRAIVVDHPPRDSVAGIRLR
jgi:quercetin dioxygenase-like cupin family protein